MNEDTPVFVISRAAELAGMHPQTLRQYDRLGLVSPRRTAGRGRRYSMRDVVTLRTIQRLSQDEGINLAGIKRILELEMQVERLERQVDHLRSLIEPGRRVFTADPRGDVVATRRAPRVPRVAQPPRAITASTAAVVLWRPTQGDD